MLIIKSILIEGIWGYKTIKCPLHRNVNILIGKNGVGKTTVLNLLSAVIKVDIQELFKVSFDKLVIEFCVDEKKEKPILFEIKRFAKNERLMISYEFTGVPISKQNFNIENSNDYHLSRIMTRRSISKYINLTWLSINRKEVNQFNDTDGQPEIDKRLEGLFVNLQDYFYRLMSRSMEWNVQFKSDVINLFLYDKDVDMPTKENLELLKNEENIDKDDLLNMFSSLGLSDGEIKCRIETHLQMIENAKKEIVLSEPSPDSTQTFNDSSTKIISLYLRTIKMLEAYHRFQKRTEDDYALLNKFLKLLVDFMPEKTFKLSSETDGKLQIDVFGRESDINYKELSSGEKQILVLLTEALLQQGEQYIYLADEPEMSLHMDWQEIIISAITQLNAEAQIIVATHSPEVAQDWGSMIIDLNKM